MVTVHRITLEMIASAALGALAGSAIEWQCRGVTQDGTKTMVIGAAAGLFVFCFARIAGHAYKYVMRIKLGV